MGLSRIKDTSSVWNSSEECKSSSKDAAFTRKDFDEYCSRAIASARANAPSTVNPNLQLSGDVATVFPSFSANHIAVRVEREDGHYKASILDLESTRSLFSAGKLPQHLYDATMGHYFALMQKQKLANTPAEFAAVYLGPYDSIITRDEKNPWPTLGSFTVESGDGTKVIRESLPMAIGDLRPKPGQVFRFVAKPSELVFQVHPRQFFNLNQAV